MYADHFSIVCVCVCVCVQCPGPRHEQIPAQLQQKRAKVSPIVVVSRHCTYVLLLYVRVNTCISPLVSLNHQFLCEAVSVYLSQRSNPKMAGTVPSAAITRPTAMMSPPSTSPSSSSSVEVVEFEDYVFLLAELWRVDVDGVRKHWTACFFAAGLGERGREVCDGGEGRREGREGREGRKERERGSVLVDIVM